MRIPRRHHTDRRRHPASPDTAGRSGRTGHTSEQRHQPPADRLADALVLLWDLR